MDIKIVLWESIYIYTIYMKYSYIYIYENSSPDCKLLIIKSTEYSTEHDVYMINRRISITDAPKR